MYYYEILPNNMSDMVTTNKVYKFYSKCPPLAGTKYTANPVIELSTTCTIGVSGTSGPFFFRKDVLSTATPTLTIRNYIHWVEIW